jgi:serine/threonine protein kinase
MSPVVEYNLTKYFEECASNPHLVDILRTFFGCLASGLQYLHENKIRHRDIKPDNILVRKHEVFLADFGISLDWEHLSRSTTTQESGRTLAYCAPEVASMFQKRNSATDIWSLGCVFVEMLVVLKGLDVVDLNRAFYANSESRSFFQNITIAYEWLDSRIAIIAPKGT